MQKPRFEDKAVKKAVQYAISFYGVVAGLFMMQAMISLAWSSYKKFSGKKYGNVRYVAYHIPCIRIITLSIQYLFLSSTAFLPNSTGDLKVIEMIIIIGLK